MNDNNIKKSQNNNEHLLNMYNKQYSSHKRLVSDCLGSNPELSFSVCNPRGSAPPLSFSFLISKMAE